ncbi:DNA polymerase IV [uncultured Oscillibacter sp.]|uniref:DNA polymerase Y family protein n=1 Tax=uncultured Oscillibacter sp. TaxID=876091 RepID=UPI00260CF8C3|nr:DNA polymerase IV [uncultured Oscillibacter sp.]
MSRIILHCDLNSFYASVELLSHPELKDVPAAVCGDPASRHGIILAKNDPAKKYGVQTAETIWLARKKCPNLLFGGAAQKILRKYGMETIGQMAACKRETLETIMGKLGTQLYEYEYANGLDESPVKSRYETEPVKSVGNGTTFSFNLTKRQQIADGIAMLTGEVASRLRHSGLYAGGVQVTVRDPEFHDRSRQRQLSVPTYLFRDLRGTAMELVNEIWKPPSPVRALRVTAINLVPEDETFEQVDLFASAASREQQERPESAMASIRDKYGNRSIAFGRTQRLGRSDEND